jgi:hypothetical protein
MTKPKDYGRLIKTTIGHDGRRIFHREVTADCKRCAQPFVCVMTTKPPRYCPECAAIVKKEKNAREDARSKARSARPVQPKPRKLIRYAGFDPREHFDE